MDSINHSKPDHLSDIYPRLIECALQVQKNSYSPYSKFRIGAALITENGQIFKGANIENASFGATICAERSAISAAISELGVQNCKIQVIAVVGDLENPVPPCGICRQVLAEFGEFPVVLYSTITKKTQHLSVKELLPFAFTPDSMAEHRSNLT